MMLSRLQTIVWGQQARPDRDDCDCGLSHSQCQPDGDWRVWYLRGGRGSGKTRTGAETLAEWIREWLPQDPKGEGEWGIVAPTFGDARDTCMEGPSGLLRALAPLVSREKNWNRSMGELWLPNGARVFCDGADDGAFRLQGKNLRGAWADEVGLWRRSMCRTAWHESLNFAVRLDPSRIVATGTPKAGHPLVAELLEDPTTVVHHMRMKDNLANLDKAAVEDFMRKHPPGSRMYRQEVEGEFITEVFGALWNIDLIDRLRVTPEQVRQGLADRGLTRVVVGVDPSGSADEDSGASECGIVVAGYSAHTGHGYVLADKSAEMSPSRWAAAVVAAYHEFRADRVVAEKNFGGEMVRAVIHTVDPNVPVKLVSASRGKVPRAEPVASLYERELVFHVGAFRQLEDQMCSYVAEAGMDSPDRMDALVWALSDLMVERQGGGQYDAYGLGGPPVVRQGDLVLIGERYIDK